MEIKHYEGINYTPAFPLALKGNFELFTAGFSQPCQTISWDMNAVSAEVDGKAIGVIVWSKIAHMKEAFVNLGYVLPASRNQGIYRKMWDALVIRAQEEKLDHISGTTHVLNESMRAVARSLGRREEGVTLFFQLSHTIPSYCSDEQNDVTHASCSIPPIPRN
jgi:RimJ/RimL family protein N-acetyltransferase